MWASRELDLAVRGTDVPGGGDGPTRRRRLAISRIVFGGVADQVMRKATCPVLTVSPKQN